MSAVENVDYRRGRLSDEEKALIGELGDKGLKAGPIAMRLNRHPATVNFAMHGLGCKKPAHRKLVAFMRNGRPVKSFSKEEDLALQALALAGQKPRAIADELTRQFGHPRAVHTVRVRLTMLANEED